VAISLEKATSQSKNSSPQNQLEMKVGSEIPNKQCKTVDSESSPDSNEKFGEE